MSVAVSSAWNVLLQIVIWFITLFRFDLCLNRLFGDAFHDPPMQVGIILPCFIFLCGTYQFRVLCYVICCYVMLLLYYIIHLFFFNCLSPLVVCKYLKGSSFITTLS